MSGKRKVATIDPHGVLLGGFRSGLPPACANLTLPKVSLACKLPSMSSDSPCIPQTRRPEVQL